MSKPRLITDGLALVVALLLPQAAFAVGGATALNNFVQSHIINQGLVAFGGIAAAALMYYAARALWQSNKEESFTNLANAFVNVFVGFAAIAIAGAFAAAFSGQVQPSLLIPGINSIIDYIISGAAGVFILMAAIAGISMMMSQGDQAVFDKWLKVLVGNSIGVIIMMVASAIVHTVTDRSVAIIVNELVGMTLFLLTIVGVLSVVALILAGVMLIVSLDEALRDRAKKAIFGTLITLGIVSVLYAVIAGYLNNT